MKLDLAKFVSSLNEKSFIHSSCSVLLNPDLATLKKKKKKRYFRAILGQLGFLVYHIVLFCPLYTVFSALNALLQHLPICPYRPHSNPILSMKPPWCLLCHRYYHPVRNHVIAYLFMLCHSFLSGKMGMIIVPIL